MVPILCAQDRAHDQQKRDAMLWDLHNEKRVALLNGTASRPVLPPPNKRPEVKRKDESSTIAVEQKVAPTNVSSSDSMEHTSGKLPSRIPNRNLSNMNTSTKDAA